MVSQDIRRRFLNYFKERSHAVIPSSSVVPHQDPTLLFNNAGMNQFKDVFLGKSQRDYQCAATSQKCIRVGGKHNDLDNVGHTSRHLTFFEMLGNFSFGDYFKEKAIAYAWEVSTTIFGFTPEHVWVTIFETDEEAFSLWKKLVPEKRIVRMGEKDNFWSMGDTGPCGPCSELLYDRGEQYGNASSPKEDASGERYLEFWNLVFMQYNKEVSGTLSPLPKQAIDTGSGLERVVSLKMGVDTVFATDILRSLIAQVETISGKKYNPAELHSAPAFHVIADHIRSLSFAIADGVQPSNIERGYVLRKLLRRAVRYGRSLGMYDPFLAKILPRLVETMGQDFRELLSGQHRIAEILTQEEESFLRTLKRGGNILSSVIERAQKSALKEVTGEEAFKLKDTYGFPLEEILLIAKDTGLQVNLDQYQLLEERAKERSRSAQATTHQLAEENLFKDFIEKNGPCTFTGYTDLKTEATVLALLKGNQFVASLTEGEEGAVLLNKTPFYAEKGGQVADRGVLSHHSAHFVVTDCHSPFPGIVVHKGKLDKGTLILGEPVLAKVEGERRFRIACNHTATHLLHFALQQILGEHIQQAGSLVEPSRLRFDFNHHKGLSSEELRLIENLVNEKIRENTPVQTYELTYEDAQKRSDIKQFFGEKYGAKVRVVDIDYSKELCGGTHIERSGSVGFFKILKEGSVAAGVRRIEATTGKGAEALIAEHEALSLAAAALLKTSLSHLPEKISSLLEENKALAAELKVLKRNSMKAEALVLAKEAVLVGSVRFLAKAVSHEPEDLLSLSEFLLSALSSGVLILATEAAGRCQLLVKVTPDLNQKGIRAVDLVKEIASAIEGTGGGKAESAQVGGKNPKGIAQAFEKAQTFLQRTCPT